MLEIAKQKMLVSGANGFLGTRVVNTLLRGGFTDIRCFVRPTADTINLEAAARAFPKARVELFRGNLLSEKDCYNATKGVHTIFNLAAGVGKSYANCFLNSVVGTRNLLRGCINSESFSRIVHISSIAVYDTSGLRRKDQVTEDCAVEEHPELRFEPYSYGKIRQERFLCEFCSRHNLPFVILRPGVIFGPGKKFIPGRVGIDTFGLFLHLGGRNKLPITYLDNCAEAIVIVGTSEGVEGEAFNIVDDELPTSRHFLKSYKKKVKRFSSVYIPYWIFRFMSIIWSINSKRSNNQLPPLFNKKRCEVYWKAREYSNEKLKNWVQWSPSVGYDDAFDQYCRYQRESN